MRTKQTGFAHLGVVLLVGVVLVVGGVGFYVFSQNKPKTANKEESKETASVPDTKTSEVSSASIIKEAEDNDAAEAALQAEADAAEEKDADSLDSSTITNVGDSLDEVQL